MGFEPPEVESSSPVKIQPEFLELKPQVGIHLELGVWSSPEGLQGEFGAMSAGQRLGFMVPSGNQTWQWKMDHLSVIFPLKLSFIGDFFIAMFDHQRVSIALWVCKPRLDTWED